VARGFESKSVESQQADAASRTRTGPPVPAEEMARRSRLASLMLARARAEADLRAATASAHRSMLESAIADLDRQIAQLQRSGS
jgi:hypothetical protein